MKRPEDFSISFKKVICCHKKEGNYDSISPYKTGKHAYWNRLQIVKLGLPFFFLSLSLKRPFNQSITPVRTDFTSKMVMRKF